MVFYFMKNDNIILIAAGGTGGHIFPGLSVADEMCRRGYRIVWVGNRNSMEYKVVSHRGIPIEFLNFHGVRGKGWLPWLKLPFTLFGSFITSLKMLVKISPSVVLVMGGYLSLPIGLASFFLRKPLVLHEQNSCAGLANRVLSLFSTRILTAYPSVFKRGEEVGNPIPKSFFKVDEPGVRYIARDGVPLQILVLGGSLGASFLNEILPAALALLPKNERPNIIHQTGEAHCAIVRNLYISHNVLDDAKVILIPFVRDMLEAYAQADLVICRAGAMTVSEVSAVGVAALFVPYPFAMDDHQTGNAQYLVKSGSADLILQNDLSPEKLASYITGLTRTSLLEKAKRARKLARFYAAQRVADICIASVKSKRG